MRVKRMRVPPAIVGWVVAAAALASAAPAGADERVAYLIETIEESLNYRVRVQTIQSLEQIAVTASADTLGPIVEALKKALRDTNALVRYAAASSLIGLGRSTLRSTDLPGVIGALEALAADPDPDVKMLAGDALTGLRTRLGQLQAAVSGSATSGGAGPVPAKFYVAVGPLGDSSGAGRDDLDDLAREYFVAELASVPGVEPHAEVPAIDAFERELRRRSLTGFVLQGSVVEMSRDGNAVSATVSILVLDHQHNLRVMLRGQGNAIRRSGALTDADLPGAQVDALRAAVRASVASLAGYLRGLR